MKNIKIFLVACVFPLWGIGGLNAQVTILDQGYCGAGGGTNLAWMLYSDSTLTISGSGNMMNCWDGFGWGDIAPWRNYRSQIKTVIIGDSVTNVGSSAFSNCNALTSVAIPNSVTIIESSAFYNCNALTSVTIPNSVTIIEYIAFDLCGLTSVIIPNSVITIQSGAFERCYNLASVTIGNSVATIQDYAFYNCTNLKSITIHTAIPPILTTSMGVGPFNGISDTIPIYVLCESVSNYEMAWSYFNNFIGFIKDTTFIYDSICQGNIYNENGFYETETGTYKHILQNVNNCDSIVILNLFVINKDTAFIFDTICQGEIYNENGFYETETGIYKHILQNANNCDSFVILDLFVASKDTTFIFDTICQGNIYNKYGFYESEAGVYTQELQNSFGCDSAVILNLTISDVGIVEAMNNEQLIINKVEIYDILGRKYSTRHCERSEAIQNIYRLWIASGDCPRNDVADFPSGVYILKLQTNKGILTKKIYKNE